MKRIIILILFTKALCSQVDSSCKYTKTYFSNGKVETEGCIKNGKKEGVWKDYSNPDGEHFVRFLWTYRNDLKDGPYQALGKTGIIEAKGHYKLGSLSDTLKSYNDKGELTDYEVWKPSGGIGSSSFCIAKKILIKPEHPEGYNETIDGKTYTWMSGRRYEIKKVSSNASEETKKNTSVALTIPWEAYDKSSSIPKTKITSLVLQGVWTTSHGTFQDGEYIRTLNLKTPSMLAFSKTTLKRAKNEEFIKYTIANNILTVKGEYQTDTGIINKITSTELIITWKVNGNYTRYFYTRQ
jgi:hypothetical protein